MRGERGDNVTCERYMVLELTTSPHTHFPTKHPSDLPSSGAAEGRFDVILPRSRRVAHSVAEGPHVRTPKASAARRLLPLYKREEERGLDEGGETAKEPGEDRRQQGDAVEPQNLKGTVLIEESPIDEQNIHTLSPLYKPNPRPLPQDSPV